MNSLLKKFIIFVAVMAIVATGGYFARKAFKRSNERRLVQDARSYIEKKEWRNAQLCLQRSLQINPLGVESFRLMAEMLEAVGAPTAVGWRARVVELEPAVAEHRFEWADTAIRVGDLASAANALAGVSETDRTSARYWKLMGAAAWGRQQAIEAENYYGKALALEPTNLVTAANLATIHLVSTNAATVALARQSLEKMSTNAAVRMVALRHLRSHAVSRRNTNDALRYSSEIEKDAAAMLGDKIDHLSILRGTGNPSFGPYLSTIKEAAKDSSPTAFAVGKWIAQNDNTTNALTWLRSLPAEVQTNQPVPLIMTDCLIIGKDWRELLKVADAQNWSEAEYYRLAVVSLAQKSLGEELAAKASWRKAIRETAGRLDRLTRLVQVTRTWRWEEEYEQLLTQLVSSYPKEKWALDALTGKYYADGKTKEIERVLNVSYQANTNDMRLKNNFANILLLRKSRLELAHALAREVYDSSPKDPFFISTYAYSLSLQDKHEEAAKIVGGIDPAFLKIPAVAAYYGAVQVRAGHKETAKDAIAWADAAPVLLPEERELVRIAKAAL